VRSQAGYWIGGVLVAAGVIGAVLWFVGSLVRLSDEVDRFERVRLPGVGTVQLEDRKYVVYYEAPGADERVPTFTIEVADAQTGNPIEIATYDGSLTYSFSGHEGSAQATVSPTDAGAYRVRAAGGGGTSDASVAFGRSLAWPIARALLGAFAIGALLVGSGATLLVVTAVRRSRSRVQVDAGTPFAT
jgi:hypothetical protein